MDWYVFALVDGPIRPTRGLTGAVTLRPVGACFVAVERRADVPPIELGSLRRHQQIVERLAGRVHAILPVRFGTLLSMDEIEESLQRREKELAVAFDLVRDRRQMTWRMRARSVRESPGRSAEAIPKGYASGTAYLRAAMHAGGSALPPTFQRVRAAVGGLSVAERFDGSTSPAVAALYHLVECREVNDYVAASADLRNAIPELMFSGPRAPYAFVPELFG
jgi:hypothetical protein